MWQCQPLKIAKLHDDVNRISLSETDAFGVAFNGSQATIRVLISKHVINMSRGDPARLRSLRGDITQGS